ncbi:Asp23/Gls24 family envelope stress response protein [Streptomyces sp. SPB4]|uniref:Asp23/Gls24 family envelope stress response protein n=1 Tax=Streptomyces sp. SPB4 TaxID=2940553 RepID=UPI0024751F66|nr:Asp23/Gls24 family envelope stress response protein [Streptomyces sp. SPB4]MDH6543699.1 hypothetical protein [Streptomyces sp. SPB4]
MTTAHSDPEAAETAIADAVLGVSGVAFLRPALSSLLRHAVAPRTGRRTAGAAPVPVRGAGVRITTAPDGEGPAVEVHVVVLRGHRAVDVTRAVREAVRRTFPSTARTIPVRVTVTGIL